MTANENTFASDTSAPAPLLPHTVTLETPIQRGSQTVTHVTQLGVEVTGFFLTKADRLPLSPTA